VSKVFEEIEKNRNRELEAIDVLFCFWGERETREKRKGTPTQPDLMRMQKAAAAAAAEGRQATTRMGTRSKGAANGNNGNSSKMHEMEVTAAASAYDSDSFENHVIDLRGVSSTFLLLLLLHC